MWIQAAFVSDIPVGSMVRIETDEDDIAIYHLPDGFYATSDTCTHASESLTRGKLLDHVVACPKHGGKFDVRTGEAVAFPCVIPLQTYPVEVRGDAVWIDV
ncbi:MAG: non-heme iron oxygenase ferredoxin subunit [Alicyclobacillus sp.]|nr:non-heme iron oxygenase ferredoxin subunit [Alicyclobacillus sp.]